MHKARNVFSKPNTVDIKSKQMFTTGVIGDDAIIKHKKTKKINAVQPKLHLKTITGIKSN